MAVLDSRISIYMDASSTSEYNPLQISSLVYESATYAKWVNPYSEYVEIWGSSNSAAQSVVINSLKISEPSGSLILSLSGIDLKINANDLDSLGVQTFQSQFSGDDDIRGSNEYDILIGFGGNDIITPNGGGDNIDGSTGIDTVALSGSRGTYFTYRKGDTTFITDNSGKQGVMPTHNVETVRFADGTYTMAELTSSATAAGTHSISRLYLSALDRLPDQAGLNSWINASRNGMTLEEIANGFVASTEFTNRYGGNLSDAGFITQLYANVLDRAPDADGQSNWSKFLSAGNSRAEALVGFSESAENIDQYKDDVLQPQVGRLYLATFDRLPDPQGETTWVNYLNAGHDVGDVAVSFVNSPEFQQRYGAPSNPEFVELLYRNVLDRAPDEAGLANWTNALDHGLSRADALADFSSSPEFVAKTDYLWV
jgi:hypothetical protein